MGLLTLKRYSLVSLSLTRIFLDIYVHMFQSIRKWIKLVKAKCPLQNTRCGRGHRVPPQNTAILGVWKGKNHGFYLLINANA